MRGKQLSSCLLQLYVSVLFSYIIAEKSSRINQNIAVVEKGAGKSTSVHKKSES